MFLEHSGFDESYGRPAIEDIELGYRLSRAKCNMILDADLRVKHLKSWSFAGLVNVGREPQRIQGVDERA